MSAFGDTTFILRKPSGKMLMQLRDDGGGKKIRYPSTWCFPGGKVEEGEAYLDCVIREIKEEYGVSIKKEACHLILTYDHDDSRNDYVYLCEIPEDVEVVCNEGKDARWMMLEEIKQLSLGWEQEKFLLQLEEWLKKDAG